MDFKNFKFISFIEVLIVSLIYPLAKVFLSTSQKLIIFSDVTFITSLILIILGIIYCLYLKGDYDFSLLLLNRVTKKDQNDKAFLQNEKEKREKSFNYPLFIGIIELIISVIVGLLL